LTPTFDIRNFGFASMRKFLESLAPKYEVLLDHLKLGKALVYAKAFFIFLLYSLKSPSHSLFLKKVKKCNFLPNPTY